MKCSWLLPNREENWFSYARIDFDVLISILSLMGIAPRLGPSKRLSYIVERVKSRLFFAASNFTQKPVITVTVGNIVILFWAFVMGTRKGGSGDCWRFSYFSFNAWKYYVWTQKTSIFLPTRSLNRGKREQPISCNNRSLPFIINRV